MPETSPSLYEMLLQNFRGELALSQVNEDDQLTLSVLDNIQRILNSRAGSIASARLWFARYGHGAARATGFSPWLDEQHRPNVAPL